jgi:hypothetical protein
MHSRLHSTLGSAVGILCLTATFAFAADQSSGPPPTAQVVEVQGATKTFQSRDMRGQLVEVAVPSNEVSDIRTGGTSPTSPGAPAGAPGQTVTAQVIGIDLPTNTATVQTQLNQTLRLQLPASTLGSMQIGEQLTLVVPR